MPSGLQSSSSEVVGAFIALWEQPDGFPQAVDTYFTADTVWENHGLITTRGPEEAIGFYDQFGAATGMAGMRSTCSRWRSRAAKC